MAADEAGLGRGDGAVRLLVWPAEAGVAAGGVAGARVEVGCPRTGSATWRQVKVCVPFFLFLVTRLGYLKRKVQKHLPVNN